MLVYRVERRVITQRMDVNTLDWSNWEADKTKGPEPKLAPSWNKLPRSPYGWAGCDNSKHTQEWLKEHGIEPGNFSHITELTHERAPAPGSESKMMDAACRYHSVNSIADLPKKWQHKFYFGFENPIQLCNWFDEADRIKLRQMGYYIAIYYVCNNEVLKGDKQLMFNLNEARQIDCIYF